MGEESCPHCGHDPSVTVSASYLAPGTRLSDQWSLGKLLGQGGFGITYLARDERLDQLRVVKEYFPNEFASREPGGGHVRQQGTTDSFDHGLRYFIKEAKILCNLHHRHIVRVFQFVECNGTAYMVLEYLPGPDMASLLADHGPFSFHEALDLMLPILDALEAAHQEEVLHRDVKPANIIVSETRGPVLIDFGASRAELVERSRRVAAFVSPGYAPVEQYGSTGKQGEYTDVYAVGATLYELVTGRTPTAAVDREETGLEAPSTVTTNTTAQQDAVIMHALAIRSVDRPQTIGELRDALRAAHDQTTTSNTVSHESSHERSDMSTITITIGREPDNDLVIDEYGVSGHHARLLVHSDRLELVDCGSVNGTYVNDEQVGEDQIVLLAPTDHVVLNRYPLDLASVRERLPQEHPWRHEAPPPPQEDDPGPIIVVDEDPGANGGGGKNEGDNKNGGGKKPNPSLLQRVSRGEFRNTMRIGGALLAILTGAVIYLASQKQPSNEKLLADTVEKARKSVFQVIYWTLGANKKAKPMVATAFVIGKDGIFATNGHVSAPVKEWLAFVADAGDRLPADVKKKLRPRVCTSGTGDCYTITHALTHPRYAKESLYDLGLLKVKAEDDLTPLELASDEVLKNLRPPAKLVLLGFPGAETGKENFGKQVSTPFPINFTGFVTTKQTQSTDDFEENMVMRHAEAGAGPGTSGSPILDQNTLVIAVHASGLGNRKTGARLEGHKYGVRVDVLRRWLADGAIDELEE